MDFKVSGFGYEVYFGVEVMFDVWYSVFSLAANLCLVCLTRKARFGFQGFGVWI